VLVAAAVVGAGRGVLAVLRSLPAALPALLVMGVMWIWVVSCLSGLAQSFFPAWVRTRGLSLYQLTFFGASAIGSTLAGVFAVAVGVKATTAGAGVLVLLVAATQRRRPLVDQSAIGRDAASLAPTSIPVSDPRAPTLILVRYVVDPENRDEFLRRMEPVGRSRRRTGARTWGLYADPSDPRTYTEAFTVGSWSEHLEQHSGRLTAYDRSLIDAVDQLAAQPVAVTHLIRAGAAG
jgi:hypothetical protein